MTRRTVRDSNGNRYILLKESSEASLVCDPETGERTHVPNEKLELLDSESPLETAARRISEPMPLLRGGVPDERALGLLVELDTEGPMAVRTLVQSYDLCESDFHGYLAELQAGGFVAETTVVGERGYETTKKATDLLDIDSD